MAAIEPRALTTAERSVLDRLLSVEYPGVAELRQQAEQALVAGRCDCGCPTFDVLVPPAAPQVSVTPSYRRAPVELRVSPTTDEPVGDVILFVEDGRMSSVEYVSYQENPPSEWPPPDRLSILDLRA